MNNHIEIVIHFLEDTNDLDTNDDDDVAMEAAANITDTPEESQPSPGPGEPEKNPPRNEQQVYYFKLDLF